MKVVLIPAYEPDKKLTEICESLSGSGFSVVVVNDGSGKEYDKTFDTCEPFATIVRLDKNCGKGAALKAGMKYIKENIKCDGFITCDADGQHRPEDVLRVSDRMDKGDKFVLTMRRPRKGIPLRSKIGNILSRFVYTLLSNRYLSDNQSGLRGFSAEYIDWLLLVERDNYDYEMNVLYYAAKQGIKISTILIDAIYIGNNESSHFKPVKDTVRIYKSLFTRALGSILAFILSEALVLTISMTIGYKMLLVTLPSVAAINCAANLILSRYVFFRKTDFYDFWNTLVYTVIHYFVYTLGCQLIMYSLPQIPLFAAFNITFAVCIPLRYYLHKFISIASRTKE